MCKIDWNLFIQFITAIGTIAVAIIAIWGDWVKAKLIPPLLKINLLNTRGELTKYSGSGTPVIFYHLKVINSRPWSIAKNCRVLLKEIRIELPNGQFKSLALNSNPSFKWTPAESTPQAINLVKEHAFDFGSLAQGSTTFNPEINIIPNNFQGYLSAGQKVRYSLQPTADNYLSENYQVFEVAWNGHWSNDLDVMSRNLIITEVFHQ